MSSGEVPLRAAWPPAAQPARGTPRWGHRDGMVATAPVEKEEKDEAEEKESKEGIHYIQARNGADGSRSGAPRWPCRIPLACWSADCGPL